MAKTTVILRSAATKNLTAENLDEDLRPFASLRMTKEKAQEARTPMPKTSSASNLENSNFDIVWDLDIRIWDFPEATGIGEDKTKL